VRNAVVSDPRGNLAAVCAVVDDVRSQGADDPFLSGFRWTADRLRSDHLAYLGALPSSIQRAGCTLVHATTWSVDDVVLPDSPEELARRMLAEGGTPVLAYGHTHHAYQRRLPGGLVTSIGAVSGSNDRDPRPAYSILTPCPDPHAEVRRIPDDALAEVAALLSSGYPVRPGITERLIAGGDAPIRA
jgi:hypothetical protein